MKEDSVADRFAVVWQRLTAPPAVAVDVGIALVCYLATVALPVKAAPMAGSSLFVLAALASVPLVWRRRYPVAVAAAVGAGTVGLAATGAQNFIPLPYGQLVATYTVAALAPPLWRLVTMLCTGAGVVVAVTVLLGQGPSTLGTAVLPFVVAYAMGTGVRARRDRIAMLEERAGRLVEEREAAAVRERERMAREIHDIVAHSVSLMVVQAESGAILAADQDKAQAAFDTISATGREAVTHLDRALGVLRGDGPPRHPLPGLADLPGLVEQARPAGLDADLVVRGEPRPVPPDLAVAAYRVAQEALTNTIKHAGARRVTISLDWQETRLRIDIVDDGRGPSPDPAVAGRGLVGMQERVRAFGGTLDIAVGEGGVGFRVTATLPLDGPGNEAG
ncbi:MAG TPA: sensor histidine kinase [Micromonosporaceae bacterium]|nr:sensor histidine kinase [Micromonosporaceae bacterium]